MKTFYDFDWTMIDTSPENIKEYEYDFIITNLTPPNKTVLKNNNGFPLRDTLKIISPSFDEKHISLLAKYNREYYLDKVLMGVYYLNIVNLLKEKRDCFASDMVSSKLELFLLKIIIEKKLNRCFRRASCISQIHNKKSKKEGLVKLNNTVIIKCIFIETKSKMRSQHPMR